MPTERRIKKMKRVLENRQADLTVVCENIHDPHNVSAILRSCDAVGVEKVHLFYTYEDFPKIGKKSSASAKKWIEIDSHRDIDELYQSLKKQGMTIYTTHLGNQSVSIYEVDWCKPAAIVVGNEHSGVSEEMLKISDQNIHIPMFGMIQSLNVSVAAAVILYEACRQRQHKKFYPYPFIDPEKYLRKLDEWKQK